MRVDFTQVTYHANGPIRVSNNGLFFNDVVLTDGNGGRGILSGGLPCRNLKNFSLDTHIKFDDMKVLAIKPDKTKVVYGDVSGSGRVDVTGPFDRILLETDCPYMTPVPFRGKTNFPAYVRYTCQKIAEILCKTFEEIDAQTTENAKRLFPRLF